MTDLEKKLFEMLRDILDGVVYPEDLRYTTPGLPLERCEEIFNTYYSMRKSFKNTT